MKKKVFKQKMYGVYSKWGFHAFYQSEELALKHWKGSKKYDIVYEVSPIVVHYSLPTTNPKKKR